jgi:hypothetical protein
MFASSCSATRRHGATNFNEARRNPAGGGPRPFARERNLAPSSLLAT